MHNHNFLASVSHTLPCSTSSVFCYWLWKWLHLICFRFMVVTGAVRCSFFLLGRQSGLAHRTSTKWWTRALKRNPAVVVMSLYVEISVKITFIFLSEIKGIAVDFGSYMQFAWAMVLHAKFGKFRFWKRFFPMTKYSWEFDVFGWWKPSSANVLREGEQCDIQCKTTHKLCTCPKIVHSLSPSLSVAFSFAGLLFCRPGSVSEWEWMGKYSACSAIKGHKLKHFRDECNMNIFAHKTVHFPTTIFNKIRAKRVLFKQKKPLVLIAGSGAPYFATYHCYLCLCIVYTPLGWLTDIHRQTHTKIPLHIVNSFEFPAGITPHILHTWYDSRGEWPTVHVSSHISAELSCLFHSNSTRFFLSRALFLSEFILCVSEWNPINLLNQE